MRRRTGRGHGVDSEGLGDGDRVSVEIEQPSQPTDRGGEVAEVVEADDASQVALGTLLNADLGDAGPVRQRQRPAVAFPVALLDSGHGPCGEESEDLGSLKW